MTQTKTYNASACGPGSADNLDHGMLWFTHEGASFKGTRAAFTLPIEGLRLDRAGATGDTIRISNPAHPDWFISTGDISMLKEPVLVSRGDLKNQARPKRGLQCCCAGGCLGIILIIVLSVFAAIASRDAMVAALATHFPPDIEKKVGDVMIIAVVPPSAEIKDHDLLAGLRTIADPILEAASADEGFTSFTLHLTADPSPNAFAIPGGHIIVNAGLINTADNADEVAGVIAHEAAHATLRHGLQSLINRLGMTAVLQVIMGDLDGLSGILVNSSDYLLNQKYSRDFERQADNKGWEYLEKANVNPQGLATFFEKLQKLQGTANAPAIMSTHPATSERISALEKKLKAVPPTHKWREFPLDFKAYQAKVKARTGE